MTTGTTLHWADGPWAGRLALAARPRGGDWLRDEIASWKSCGIDVVCSFLAVEEALELGLELEQQEAERQGLKFVPVPIVDRQVPASEFEFLRQLESLERDLAAGRNVVLHCRQGIGRTGLVAACLLVASGHSASAAVEQLSAARGIAVPETLQQRQWIDHFAESLVGTK